MSADTAVLAGGEREAMNSTMRSLGRRVGAFGLAALLALALAGDRGRAATVPAAIYGQDPLEILELKVRPNVVIVLDSSGSMGQTTTGSGDPRRGDHPRAKLFQAKTVLNQIIADNQDKVNFMMSQYFQVGSGFDTAYTGAGVRRLQYTSTTAAPIRKALNDTENRGFQSWQDIRAGWNTLYFDEQNGATVASCAVTVPAQFYQTGAALATALETAMDNCNTRGSFFNNYTVAYNPASGVFTFSRNSADTRDFEMRWDLAANSIKGALGVTGGRTGLGDGPHYSGTPYTLLSTSETWPGVTGAMDMTGSFTDASVTYYQAGASRIWNGETLKVQADGTICDLTAAPAPPLPSPAEFYVQSVEAGCGTDVGTAVTYTFSGAPMTQNSEFCTGAENKVSLLPCDLGDSPTQISLIGSFLDFEFPFKDDGTPGFYTESQDGTYGALTWPAADDAATPDVDEAQGGIRAAGGTPMANSSMSRRGSTRLTNGQGRLRRQTRRPSLVHRPDQGPPGPQGEDDRPARHRRR
jgi:hypothetical protein